MSKKYEIFYSAITNAVSQIEAETPEQAAEIFYKKFSTNSNITYLIDEIADTSES